MVVQKVGFLALLLLFGTFLLVSKVQHADAKACTRECDGRIAYAICPRLGINNKIKQLCTNCCAGFKGCNYYSADGKFICEGESEYVSNQVENGVGKACTKECDTRIAFGICPLASGNKRIHFDRICTNCCAGKKGCNYFSEDGTFICEGESEYVSNKVENGVGKACTLQCDPRIAYGICPLASGNERISFDRICTNCCAGKKGCNYFSADGTFICEGESKYVSNKVENDVGKACTLECDFRIAYGICPLASGNKRISFDRICTNCCAGKKGCNYFSADGTFICEGESKYVSKEENDLAVA